MDQMEIAQRFGFHRATIEGPEATLPRHTMLRRAYIAFVGDLNRVLPEGRYSDLAMDCMENASMWAHKAIASKAPLGELPEVHDDETMHKVYKALLDVEIPSEKASEVIREMQNAGILFREFQKTGS